MLTKGDLLAIGALIKAENESLKEAVEQIKGRMVTKADLEVNNKVIGTIVRAEVGSLRQELVKLVKFMGMLTKKQKAQGEKIEELKNNLHLSKN